MTMRMAASNAISSMCATPPKSPAWLLDHPEVSGIFNVGSGQARTFYDLAMATFAAAQCEPEIDFIDMP